MTEITYRYEHSDYVSAPGETLRELLAERGMSQATLALRLGRPKKTVNEIIHGKAQITPETALALEHVLGLSSEFWLRREGAFRSFVARRDEAERLAKSTSCLEHFSVGEMMRRGWIRTVKTKVDQLRECLDFYQVATVDQLTELAPATVHFRHETKFESDRFALGAWLRRGEQLATLHLATTPEYDKSKFESLVQRCAALTLLPIIEAMQRLRTECLAAGVIVVFVPELRKSRVCGASRWIGGRPVIQLSFRSKSDDELWFTLLHEAAHALLHSHDVRVDELKDAGSDSLAIERQADEFATSMLIAPDALNNLIASRSKIRARDIEVFAMTLSVAPSVVVGQLQKRKVLRVGQFQRLKRVITDDEQRQLSEDSAKAAAPQTSGGKRSRRAG